MKLWFLMVCCLGWAMPVPVLAQVLNRPGCEVADFGGPPDDFNQQQYNQAKIYRWLQQKPEESKDSRIGALRDSAEAWDQWHKRVAEAIDLRFKTLANCTYRNYPMSASAVYTVTSDRRIINARMVEKHPNPIFNAIILTAINSINKNSELQFPAGSEKVQVEKSQTFTQIPVPGYRFNSTHCGPM